MVAIPFLKLFSLTVKTLAKPMAKRMKTEAQRSDTLRGVLNQMGQTVNMISVRITIGMSGHTMTKIKALEEDRAVAAGGELLAEGFVYGVAGALVIWEYMSSASDKEAKDVLAKAKKAKEQEGLKDALEAINRRLTVLEMTRLERAEDQSDTLHRDDVKASISFPLVRWIPFRPLGTEVHKAAAEGSTLPDLEEGRENGRGVRSDKCESQQTGVVRQGSEGGQAGTRSSNPPNRVQENTESEARIGSTLTSEGNARELKDRGAAVKYNGSGRGF